MNHPSTLIVSYRLLGKLRATVLVLSAVAFGVIANGCATTSGQSTRPIEAWTKTGPSFITEYQQADELFFIGRNKEANSILRKLAREGYPPAIERFVYRTKSNGSGRDRSLAPRICRQIPDQTFVDSRLVDLAFYGEYEAFRHYWECVFNSNQYTSRITVDRGTYNDLMRVADYHARQGDLWSMGALIDHHLSYGRLAASVKEDRVVLKPLKPEMMDRRQPINIDEAIRWMRFREEHLGTTYYGLISTKNLDVLSGRTDDVSKHRLIDDYLDLPFIFARYYEDVGSRDEMIFWAEQLVMRGAEAQKFHSNGSFVARGRVAELYALTVLKNL